MVSAAPDKDNGNANDGALDVFFRFSMFKTKIETYIFPCFLRSKYSKQIQ